MKKIFWIGLISLFLSGCDKTVSDEVVSNEMLIGNWECNIIDYESSWDKNKFGELKKIHENKRNRVLVSFKYENNSLYSKTPDAENWEKERLIEKYNNKTIQQEDDFSTRKRTYSLKKVSDDKFIMTYEFEQLVKDEKDSKVNSKVKNETICTRIK